MAIENGLGTDFCDEEGKKKKKEWLHGKRQALPSKLAISSSPCHSQEFINQNGGPDQSFEKSQQAAAKRACIADEVNSGSNHSQSIDGAAWRILLHLLFHDGRITP